MSSGSYLISQFNYISSLKLLPLEASSERFQYYLAILAYISYTRLHALCAIRMSAQVP